MLIIDDFGEVRAYLGFELSSIDVIIYVFFCLVTWVWLGWDVKEWLELGKLEKLYGFIEVTRNCLLFYLGLK